MELWFTARVTIMHHGLERIGIAGPSRGVTDMIAAGRHGGAGATTAASDGVAGAGDPAGGLSVLRFHVSEASAIIITTMMMVTAFTGLELQAVWPEAIRA